MNRELLYLYRGLSEHIKASITALFQDSPKTLLLATFLEKETEDDFKSSKAVHFIYQQEQKEEKLSHSILVNRYYKLRQTFRQWLIAQLRSNESYVLPEESELLFLRFMVAKNQFAHAEVELGKLSAHCRRQGLYELLPEVERLRLLCLQSFRMHDEQSQKQQLAALQEAIEWNYQLQQLSVFYMQCFNMDLLSDSLDQIRKICSKFPQLIRFQLIYRYTAFFRGVFNRGMNQKSRHVLVRHLNELTQLMEQNPQMPILHLAHRERVLYNLELAKMAFFMTGNDFSQALKCIYTRQKLGSEHPFLVEHKSDPEYRNYIIVFITNGLYKEALEEAQRLYQRYQQQAGATANRARVEIAYCYIFGLAVLRPSSKEIETTLRVLADLAVSLENMLNSRMEVTAARWWLLLVLRRWEEANEWMAQYGWEACTYPMNYELPEEAFWKQVLYVLANDEREAAPALIARIQAQIPSCRPPWQLYWYKLMALL